MHITSQLARDLQEDFLPLFQPLCSALLGVLDSGGLQDAALFEHIFTGLYKICKFLVNFLTKDHVLVASCTAPFIYHKHRHVRRIASKMLSYLVRNADASDLDKIVRHILQRSGNYNTPLGSKADSVAELLVESLSSVKSALHSKAGAILETFVNLSVSRFTLKGTSAFNYPPSFVPSSTHLAMHKLQSRIQDLDFHGISGILFRYTGILIEAMDKQSTSMLNEMKEVMCWFFKTCTYILTNCRGAQPDLAVQVYSKALQRYSIVFEALDLTGEDLFRGINATITAKSSFILLDKEALGNSNIVLEHFAFSLSTISYLVDRCDASVDALSLVAHLEATLNERMLSAQTTYALCKLSLDVLESMGLRQTLVPLLLRMCANELAKNMNLNVLHILHQVAEFFVGESRDLARLTILLVQYAVNVCTLTTQKDDETCQLVHLVVLWVMEYGSADDMVSLSQMVYSFSSLDQNGTRGLTLKCKAGLLAIRASSDCMPDWAFEMLKEAFSTLKENVRHFEVLKVLTAIFKALPMPQKTNNELCRHIGFETWQQLMNNLGSSRKDIRMETLRLLSMCDGIQFEPECYGSTQDARVLADIHDTFQKGQTLENAKTISNEIKRHALDVEYGRITSSLASVLCKVFLGPLMDSFTVFWEPCVTVLRQLMLKHPKSTWNIVYTRIHECHRTLLDHNNVPILDLVEDEKSTESDEENKAFDDTNDVSVRVKAAAFPTQYKNVLSAMRGNKQLFMEKADVLLALFLELTRSCCSESLRISSLDQSEILFEWVTLLSAVPNIQKVSCHEDLKLALECLIPKVNSLSQVRIVQCLQSWPCAVLKRHAQLLITACNLKSEKELYPFREPAGSDSALSDDERKVLVPLLLRILYPKMKKKKMRLTSKRSQGTARRTLLLFLASFPSEELMELLEMFVNPLLSWDRSKGKMWTMRDLLDGSNTLSFLATWDCSAVPLSVQKGFIEALKDFKDCLGNHLEKYITPCHNILACCIRKWSIKGVNEGEKQVNPQDILSSCIRMICLLHTKYKSKPLLDSIDHVIVSMKKMAESGILRNMNVFLSSMKLLEVLSSSPDIISASKDVRSVYRNAFLTLEDPSMHAEKRDAVLDVIVSLMHGKDDSLSTHYIKAVLTEVQSIDFASQDTKYVIHLLEVVQQMARLLHSAGKSADTLEAMLRSLQWFNVKRNIRKNRNLFVTTLHALSSLLDQASRGNESDSFQIDISAFVELFSNVDLHDLRMHLCDTLEKLSLHFPSLKPLACTACALNAMSKEAIEEIDYDRRLKAYFELQKRNWNDLMDAERKVYIYQCIHDLNMSEDFSLQQACSETLKQFITTSATANEGHEQASTGSSCPPDYFYAILRRGLKHKSDSVRKEYLHLLSHLVAAYPVQFEDMKSLIHDDFEQDFFKNITHLQFHRRIRAIVKLKEMAVHRRLSTRVMVDIGFQLFISFLCDKKSNAGGSYGNLIDSGISMLGAMASSVKWTHVRFLIQTLLRIAKKDQGSEKTVMRSISAALSFFDPKCDPENRMEGEPLQFTQQSILPYLNYVFYRKEDPSTHVVGVLAQTLKLLPKDVSRIEVPQLIHRLTKLLRHELLSMRDVARSGLAALLKEIGPTYLSDMVRIIDSSLRNTGTQGYVKGFTIFKLMKDTEGSLQHKEIDCHLQAFLDILELDIFGDVARDRQERKDADKLFKKSFREGLRCYSFDTLQTLVQSIDLETSLETLLDFVSSHHNTSTARLKLTARLFEHCVLGIMANPVPSIKFLFVLLYSYIDDLRKANSLELEKQNAAGRSTSISTFETIQDVHIADAFELSLNEVRGEFALCLLWKMIKNGRVKMLGVAPDEGNMMLEPWCPLLVDLLDSRKSSVVILCLKTLNHLFCLPLSTNVDLLPTLSKRLFIHLRKAANISDDIAQECIKLLTVMLRHFKSYTPTGTQMNFMMRFLSADIGNVEGQSIPFAFMRAVIGKGIVLPALYDMMEQVQCMIIHADHASSKRGASQVFLQYLLDYPMNEQRRKGHFEYILKNCAFIHDSGRLAMLDLVKAIMEKFPEEIVRDAIDIFFFPLILRVCSDRDAKCIEAANQALSHLMGRADDACKDKWGTMAMSWLQSPKMALKAAGCQVIRFLLDSGSPSSPLRLSEHLLTLVNVSKLMCSSDSCHSPDIFVHILSALISFMRHSQLSQVFTQCTDEIFDVILALMLAQNANVRTHAIEVLIIFLEGNHLRPEDLHEQRFSQIFRHIVDQIQSDLVEENGALVLKAATALLARFDSSEMSLWSERYKEIAKEAASGHSYGNDGESHHCRRGFEPDLYFAIKRAVSLASGNTTKGSRATGAQQWCGLSIVHGLVNALDTHILSSLLPLLIMPVYNANEKQSDIPLGNREVVSQIVALLDENLGSNAVALAYSQAKKNVLGKKKERKQAKAVKKLMDPEQAAADSIKRNLKRKVSRQRNKSQARRRRTKE